MVAFVLLGVLLFVSLASTQELLPIVTNATVIEGTQGACPASEVTNAARDAVTEMNLNIISDNLDHILPPDPNVPSFCTGRGWQRVTFVNMTDTADSCPDGLSERSYNGLRLCGLASTVGVRSCASTTFPVGASSYTEVCGRLVGFQFGDAPGFVWFRWDGNTGSVENVAFDGVMITHGIPDSREHIWSFITGKMEVGAGADGCPCATTSLFTIPSYIGDEYFCESGTVHYDGSSFLGADPLWDGDGCTAAENTCCSFNSPPYFQRQLPTATSDDIELRVCALHGPNGPSYQGETVLQFIELYIK